MKKNKFINGFKTYNYVMQEVWKLLTTLLFGILAGYLLQKNGPDGNHYFVIAIIIGLIIGLINFFVGIIKLVKLEEKKKLKQKELKEIEKQEL